MRRLLTATLSGLLILSLTGCGGDDSSTTPGGSSEHSTPGADGSDMEDEGAHLPTDGSGGSAGAMSGPEADAVINTFTDYYGAYIQAVRQPTRARELLQEFAEDPQLSVAVNEASAPGANDRVPDPSLGELRSIDGANAVVVTCVDIAGKRQPTKIDLHKGMKWKVRNVGRPSEPMPGCGDG